MNEFDRVGALAMRHLMAFETVAEERSFTRAAHRLGYTQSAVSHQMATLERLVGKQLIERPRGSEAATLTEAGEVLHRHARALISRVKPTSTTSTGSSRASAARSASARTRARARASSRTSCASSRASSRACRCI